MTSSETPLTRVVHERYRLLSRLGRGGMGNVWLAADLVLGRTVALKELVHQSDPRFHEESRKRTEREAQALARLRHRAIVQIFDVFNEDGEPWIVMEHVSGRSLGDLIESGERISERTAAQIGLEVSGALRVAHQAGVLHRDVKPHNIIMTQQEHVILVDFGIAQVSGVAPLTAQHIMLGTVEFISPERITGGRGGPPGDLWSLGVTLFYALEGYSPFRRDGVPTTMWAIMNDPIPAPTRSGRLTATILNLLDRDPLRRPTPDELARTLRDLLKSNRSPQVPAVSRNEPPPAAVPPKKPEARPTGLAAQRTAEILSAQPGRARNVLRALDLTRKAEVLGLMPTAKVAQLIADSDADDAAALLSALAGQPSAASAIMRLLPPPASGTSLDHLPLDVALLLLKELTPSEAAAILAHSDTRTAAAVVGALPLVAAGRLVETMSLKRAGRVLTYVPPLTIAALLRAGTDGRAEQLLASMAQPVRRQVLRHM